MCCSNSSLGEGTPPTCKRPYNLSPLPPTATKRPRINFLSESDSDADVESPTEPIAATSADLFDTSRVPNIELASVKMQLVWPWSVQSPSASPQRKPASKTEMDILEVYEERRMTAFVHENYLSHLERVSASGHFLTKGRLLSVLATTKTVDKGDFTRRVCTVLQQDLQGRSDPGLDAEPLCELLQDSVASSPAKSDISLFTAHSMLHYIATVLVKDLNHHLSQSLDLTSTLVQRTLGIQRQWRTLSGVVDALFFTLKGVELPVEIPDPVGVLATMLCLPLVTCSSTELNCSVGRLATEISRKLESLASFEVKQALLLSLPSHLLCARVADIHLNNFVLYWDVSQLCSHSQSDPLTLQKVAHIHLCRTPYQRDGTHDLHYFLFLLLFLLRNFFQQLAGGPVLNCMVPIPSASPSPTALPLPAAQRFQLAPHFNIMIDRISENDAQLESLTSPQCWAYIQLIRTLLVHEDKSIQS